MKITQTITIASVLIFAAGCAHEQRSVRTDETVSLGYSSARSEYNTQNNLSNSSMSGTLGETKTPQGSDSQSDNTIVAQVRETLSRDPEIAFVVPNLQIRANNGAINLSGSVQSEEQERQILSKVQGIAGVVSVNNQLNVVAGSNGQENSNGSQLNPTSNSGSDRLYKDAAKGDNSTNNVLNPASTQSEAHPPLYRESHQNQNINNVDTLNPTSRENGSSQIYQNGSGEKLQDQNANPNSNQQMP